MKIEEIKNEMRNWLDFHGQDISDTDAIDRAKSKTDLTIIMNKHRMWLEDQLQDAIGDLEDTMKEWGIR